MQEFYSVLGMVTALSLLFGVFYLAFALAHDNTEFQMRAEFFYVRILGSDIIWLHECLQTRENFDKIGARPWFETKNGWALYTDLRPRWMHSIKWAYRRMRGTQGG